MSKKVKVSRVIDGDTFVGKSGGQEKFFRLAGVDTPEKGRTGFGPAKSALIQKIGGKTVSVAQRGTSYGRSVVDVKTPRGASVNNAMKKYRKKK